MFWGFRQVKVFLNSFENLSSREFCLRVLCKLEQKLRTCDTPCAICHYFQSSLLRCNLQGKLTRVTWPLRIAFPLSLSFVVSSLQRAISVKIIVWQNDPKQKWPFWLVPWRFKYQMFSVANLWRGPGGLFIFDERYFLRLPALKVFWLYTHTIKAPSPPPPPLPFLVHGLDPPLVLDLKYVYA